MGDPRRFDILSKWIASNFSKNIKIADIAAGQGILQESLRQKGFNNVVSFDKRNKRHRARNLMYKYRLFDDSIKDKFDLLVGMHPDEATDVIIREAGKRRIPFLIVPCCVMPCATTLKTNYNFTNWIKHLTQYANSLGYRVQQIHLKFSGKNLMLYGQPL